LESPAQIYLASKEVYGMEEEIGKSGGIISQPKDTTKGTLA
jgi:hypothetical protein